MGVNRGRGAAGGSVSVRVPGVLLDWKHSKNRNLSKKKRGRSPVAGTTEERPLLMDYPGIKPWIATKSFATASIRVAVAKIVATWLGLFLCSSLGTAVSSFSGNPLADCLL